MKKLLTFVTMAMFTSSLFAADLNLSPSSLKLTVYKFAVSTSPLCTNPITVVDNGSTPVEVEFVGGVNLGSGTLPTGTYPCVIVEFSSVIKFTPSANSTSTNCSTAVESSIDVCRNPSTSVLIDSSSTTCTGGDDRIAMYLSTASALSTGVDAFNPPITIGDTNYGFNLGSALVVSGTTAGKFIVNPAGQVCDDNAAGCDGGAGGTGVGTGACQMMPPVFSFTQL